jgi:hypothetical protein
MAGGTWKCLGCAVAIGASAGGLSAATIPPTVEAQYAVRYGVQNVVIGPTVKDNETVVGEGGRGFNSGKGLGAGR